MHPTQPVPRRAIAGWVLFDWAAQPFFTLIITFVYAPYFASAIAANPVEGQALWGFATAAAGLVVAALSPVLGSIADAGGRRKPWIAVFGVLLVAGSWMLWFGRAGDASVIPQVLIAYAIGVIGVEFAGVFNNAMMPSLVPPDQLGRLSGTGWATGYVGGLLSLVVVLGFLAGSPQTGKTLFGILPLFGLDVVAREGASESPAAATDGGSPKPPASASVKPAASAAPASSAKPPKPPVPEVAAGPLDELARVVGLAYSSDVLANERQHVRLRQDDSDRARMVISTFSSHAAVSTLSRNAPRAAVIVFGSGSLERAPGANGPAGCA